MEETSGDAPTGIGTLLSYLIGNRQAILTIAGNRHALWIGFLFVLSAGFAREYDGEDLLHEPWHLLLPVGASLASSFFLFTMAYGVAAAKGAPLRAFLANYASFLGLFWMTAPLAWLYAVPYERFFSPVDAMRMNLLSLGIVSAWRVALMVRVMTVILNYTLLEALCLVMLFADAIALWLLNYLPFPLIVVMGGVRLSEVEKVQQAVAIVLLQFGGCSLPFWLLGCAGFLVRGRPAWQVSLVSRPLGRSLVIVALGSVLIWGTILPWTQPEQIRKRASRRHWPRGGSPMRWGYCPVIRSRTIRRGGSRHPGTLTCSPGRMDCWRCWRRSSGASLLRGSVNSILRKRRRCSVHPSTF